ncbi:hypothetical protein ACS0TY_001570 [Phlomoides rotata]
MSSVFQLQRNQSLPLSQAQEAKGPGIRRRLSSLSLNLKIQAPSSSPAWASKSGTSIRKWWEWGWGWILSRKPTFASDLEMNEEETALLGSHNRGSWRHVFYKVISQVRRKLLGADNVGLPQTYSVKNKKKDGSFIY